ncbi:hypothetical protein FIBSPDRAFT_1053464 [Athelia psychrophila]|uniref:Uncharacterized protein n=1 Tax=Athelia psychrophila TaxID=1759441 RepID=A0A167WXP3_9AGAM|nr:hypothetical protein FIBSPDRAFT_1053464 [Fibularhizoctonia sp. CBS 109695]
MSLTLSPVETFSVSLPTLKGIMDIRRNLVAIVDWLTVHHRVPFIASGVFLWAYPGVFTWPVSPLKRTSLWTLHMLGFEKGRIRPDSYATRYQRDHYGGTIPKYSTFSKYQAAGGLDDDWEYDMEPEEARPGRPLYARLLGWIAGILAVRAFFSKYDLVLRLLKLGELLTRLDARMAAYSLD